MELSKLYKILLLEFGMPMSPASTTMPTQLINPLPPVGPGMVPPPANVPPPAPPEMPQSEQPIIHLPEVNMTVSLFPSQKKIVFAPQDHTAYTNKIRTYVNMMKQNFRIDDVNFLGQGAFEIVFDPRENFESVIQFLRQVGQSA